MGFSVIVGGASLFQTTFHSSSVFSTGETCPQGAISGDVFKCKLLQGGGTPGNYWARNAADAQDRHPSLGIIWPKMSTLSVVRTHHIAHLTYMCYGHTCAMVFFKGSCAGNLSQLLQYCRCWVL